MVEGYTTKERVIEMLYRDIDDGKVYTIQQIANEFDLLRAEYPTIYNYPLSTYLSKFFTASTL